MKLITEEPKRLSRATPALLTESPSTDSAEPTDSAGERKESKTESKSGPESKTGLDGYPVHEGVRFSAAQKLQALRQSVLKDPFIDQELAYYVPPHGQPMAVSAQGQLLQPWIEREFLHSDARVLLIQGPGGAGKSTFNRDLCRRLWRDPAWSEWKPGDAPPAALAPVFIALGSSEVEPRRLLHSLTQLPEPLESFSEEELNVLKSDYGLLVIADGYDEIPQGCRLNLYDVNSLDRYAGRIKLLVSRRDSTEVSDQQFVPHTRSGQSEYRYYRVRYLSPFTEWQRESYLTGYLAQNKDNKELQLWPKPSDYLERFKSIPGLDALIGTPFLLCIAAEVLPGIVAEVEQEASREEKARGTDPAPSGSHSESESTAPSIPLVDKELKYASPAEQEHKTIPVDPGGPEKKVESLPSSEIRSQRITITRLRLYHQFMIQWFARQAKKAGEAKELLSNPEELLGDEAEQIRAGWPVRVSEEEEKELAVACLKQAYLRFCQQLALHFHAEQRTRVQYPAENKRRGLSKVTQVTEAGEEAKTASREPEAEWVKALFGSEEPDWRRVRQGCPLRQSAAHEHEFLHASLIDYFAATVELERAAAYSEPAPETTLETPVVKEKREEKSRLETAPEPMALPETLPLSSLPPTLAESPPTPKVRRGLGAACQENSPPSAQKLPDKQPEFVGFLLDDLKGHPEKVSYYHH